MIKVFVPWVMLLEQEASSETDWKYQLDENEILNQRLEIPRIYFIKE